MKKPKVAFICVHNSCRSQMAEAISKLIAEDTFDCFSAGTHIKDKINEDAVRTIKELYNIDMEKTQKSKLINSIPPVDIVDRKSTRLNSSHVRISYAVFCLKKKK